MIVQRRAIVRNGVVHKNGQLSRPLLWFGFLLSLIVAVIPANAAIIAGNLGSSLDNEGSRLRPLSGIAQSFIITSGVWDITEIKMELGLRVGTPTPVLQIRNGSGPGGLPGNSILASMTLDISDIPTDGFAYVSVTPSMTLTLSAGTYWIYANETTADTSYNWATSFNTEQTGTSGSLVLAGANGIAKTTDNVTTFGFAHVPFPKAALLMDVVGVAVPEPTPIAVLAALVAMASIGFRARALRK